MSSYRAADIEILEGLEGVRRRPGMYIGGTDLRALHHLVAELLDNSMDEAVAGHANKIRVTLASDGSITVRDNGRGIPVDPHPRYPDRSALEVVLTTLHAGGKFNDKVYTTSAGLHGVGLSVVTALSEWMEVTVERDGYRWRQLFARGKSAGELERLQEIRRSGTSIRFKPDPEIFADLGFQSEKLHEMCRSRAYLNRGVTIELAIDGEEKVHQYHFPNGLRDYLRDATAGEEVVTPDLFEGRVHNFGDKRGRVEWAMVWIASENSRLLTYCNTVPTPGGGAHETGLRTALLRGIREYAEARNLLSRGITITWEDLQEGLLGVLSLFIPEPEFAGQTKDRLNNSWVGRQIETVIKDHLDHWLHGRAEQSNRLVEFLAERAKERLSRKRDATKVTRKSATTRLTLPGKLTDCSIADPTNTELFIVEGDSAGGTAKQARDRHTQAILPLRGKILNVEQANEEKFEKNIEIQSLITAIGAGCGNRFDPAGLRYGRIIIMTDADVDGAHIASLLLTFFYRYMPMLIQKGHLYLAQPPLYRITAGTESVYALNDGEKETTIKRLRKRFPRATIGVSRFKGLGEMAASQLRETTMSPKSRYLLRVFVDDEPLTRDTFDRLMGKRPVERFRFIQEKAIFSREHLDI